MMNTFFEKLTGVSSRPTTIDSTNTDVLANATETQRRAPRRNPSVHEDTDNKATHVKVETDHTFDEETEPAPEEEGELTVDIYDNGDSIVIQSTVAGVKPEDLDVAITDDTVTIRGRRERSEEVHEEHYYYKELFWGTFSRSVILPEEVDDEAAEATLKHGLLTIRLPKKRRGVVQKLKVKVT